ncbi:MAG: ABC transporter [Draconibacterium sp.]|nr:MAG: ABC transporter [Draconibacterium sp.]PIF06446.1 MAG: ABC transporter [Draconibacterium sp.]
MNTILYILQKEFRQILRNRTMLQMIFGVPLLQMLILVFAATFDMKKIDMVVVDKDLSETSRGLIAKFDGVPFFNLEFAVPNEALGEKMLLADKADIVMIIPQNMERNLIRDNKAQLQLLVNAIEGNSAQLIYGYSLQIIGNYNKHLIAAWKGLPGFNPPTEIKIADRYWFNSYLDFKWYMAPGILAILVTIIGMFMSGMNLVHEKESGTIEQLNVTPIKKYQFIIGKLIPFWVIGLFDLAFGLLIAKLVFNLPVLGNLWLLFGMASVYMVGVLALGLFISTVADNQQQVMFVSYFFMVVFILTSGIFTPVESMPHWVQIIDQANPIYHFMRIMRNIILKGAEFSDLIKEFASLVILGIIFFTLAIWRYRKTA